MWIEILADRYNMTIEQVILYVRMWIEMHDTDRLPPARPRHPLCEDVD